MTAAARTLPCITKDLVKEKIFIYASPQRSKTPVINVLPAVTGGKQPVQPAEPGHCLDVWFLSDLHPAALSCVFVYQCHIFELLVYIILLLKFCIHVCYFLSLVTLQM